MQRKTSHAPLMWRLLLTVGAIWMVGLSLGTSLTVFMAHKVAADPTGFSEAAVTVSQSLFFVGFASASALLMPSADRFDRKPLCLALLAMAILFGLASAWATSAWQYGAAMFALGLTLPCSGQLGYLLIQESLPERLHAFVTVFLSCGFSVSLALVALCSRSLTAAWSWRHETSLCYSLLLPILLAAAVLVKEPSKAAEPGLPSQKSEDAEVLGKELRGTTLLTVLCWTSCSVGYYGLSFLAGGLSSDLHMNVVLLGVVDVVGFCSAMPLVQRIGARRSQAFAFSGAALALFAAVFLPAGSTALVACVLVCRGLLDIAFTTVYLLIMECYGPRNRAAATGVANAVSRISTFAAPLFALAPPVATRLLLGAMCAGATVATCRLRPQAQ